MRQSDYDFKEFSAKYCKTYGGLTQRIETFFKDKSVDCLLSDDIYNFFGTDKTISKTVFYRTKNILCDFVMFVNPQNEEQIIQRIKMITQKKLAAKVEHNATLFKELDQVLDTIREIVLEKNLHNSDAAPLQSIAIFIWYGYSNEAISNFKINDIQNIEIASSYKDILEEYANLKYYRSLPSGKVQNLLNGSYLFRSANAEWLNTDDIKHIISKINTLFKIKNKNFNRSALEKSKRFKTIFMQYNKDVDANIIKEYFGKDLKKDEIEKILIEYQQWCNL